MADNTDPVPDKTATQNFIEWYIDPRSRAVTVAPSFGAFPLHLKEYDDFNWLIRLRVGGATGDIADSIQLTNLTGFKFVMLEKGRFNGTPLATGEAGAWDDDLKCYPMIVSLNSPALLAYFTALDALGGNFGTGSYDCPKDTTTAPPTTTKTTVTNGDTTTETDTTTPGTTTSAPLTDTEFMAMFQWEQGDKRMSSVTFTIFIARNLLLTSGSAGVVTPPDPPVDWRFMVAMVSEGTPFVGETFGYFKATTAVEVLGMQVSVQQVSATDSCNIVVTDGAGTNLDAATYVANVAQNTKGRYFQFGQVLVMQPGDEIRLKVATTGGADPHNDSTVQIDGLSVNLVARQFIEASPAGPSGGPGVTQVDATTLPAGSAATATLEGATLHLGIPRGGIGEPGNNGTIIDSVDVTMLPTGTPPTGEIAGTTLTLEIPFPAEVEVAPTVRVLMGQKRLPDAAVAVQGSHLVTRDPVDDLPFTRLR